MNQLGLMEKRRRNLRIILFVIILGTLPLYCLGFILWGTSPITRGFSTPTSPPVTAGFIIEATATPNQQLPSLTPFTFPTQDVILPPSPYFPPAVTRFLSPTATFYIFPSATNAPTLTLTSVPPSATPIPLPSSTPHPDEYTDPDRYDRAARYPRAHRHRHPDRNSHADGYRHSARPIKEPALFDLKTHLKTLTETHAPSGYEDPIRAVLRQEWAGLVELNGRR